MPTKTKRDEHKWERAKEVAAEAGKKENYAYIMGIYKKMKPDYEFKSGPAAKAAAAAFNAVYVDTIGGIVGIKAITTLSHESDPKKVAAAMLKAAKDQEYSINLAFKHLLSDQVKNPENWGYKVYKSHKDPVSRVADCIVTTTGTLVRVGSSQREQGVHVTIRESDATFMTTLKKVIPRIFPGASFVKMGSGLTLSDRIAMVAADFPNHEAALLGIAKEASGWVPGELKDTWEPGAIKIDSVVETTGDGSQVPPVRDNEGHQLNEAGEPIESIPRVPPRNASIEDEWAKLAQSTRMNR